MHNNTNHPLLEKLCSALGPSACEKGVQQTLAKHLSGQGIAPQGDAIGNLYAHINPEADFKIAIVAHADEVGVQVSDITSDGLIKFRKLGGVRCTSLIGQKVVLLTAQGTATGIVGHDPLQNNGTDTGITLRTNDLWIDLGAESLDEARAMVAVGDYGVLAPDFFRLGQHRICSKALDNRLGLYIMCQAMERLKTEGTGIGVTAVSTVLEEVNMHGILACKKDFQAAIVLDVDFATDVPTDHPEMGLLKLGHGIGLNINADSNRVLQDALIEVLKKHNLPYQSTLSRNISGGTDASKLHACGDIATLNINVPLRYMHSRHEMCDSRDIDTAIESLVALIKYIEEHNIRNFVPWNCNL